MESKIHELQKKDAKVDDFWLPTAQHCWPRVVALQIRGILEGIQIQKT